MAGLGAPLGYVAIITGQIFLFVYSGLIAHKGAQYGLNFPLMCKAQDLEDMAMRFPHL